MDSRVDRAKLIALIKEHDQHFTIPNLPLADHKRHCIVTYGGKATQRWVRQAYRQIHEGRSYGNKHLPYLSSDIRA